MINSPLEILPVSACVIWLNGDNSTNFKQVSSGEIDVVDRSPVGFWRNLGSLSSAETPFVSGHFTNVRGSLTTRPTYISSLSCLRFDGSNDYLTLSAAQTYLEQTTFIVASQRVQVNGARIYSQTLSNVTTDSFSANYIPCYVTGTNQYGSWNNNSARATVNSRGLGIFDIYTSWFSETSSINFLNGVASNTFASPNFFGSTLNQTFTAARIGAGLTTPSNHFNGDVSEVIVYNKALTNAEREDVEYYLSRKWSAINIIPRQVYALKNGFWNGTDTWSVSADPAPWNIPLSSDNVYTNSFLVTANQNINVLELTNINNATSILSGGSFIIGTTFSPSITSNIIRIARSNNGVIDTIDGCSFSFFGLLNGHMLENSGTVGGALPAIRINNNCTFAFQGSALPGGGRIDVNSQQAPCIHIIGGGNTINLKNSFLIAVAPNSGGTTSRRPMNVGVSSTTLTSTNRVNIENCYLKGGGSSSNTFASAILCNSLSAVANLIVKDSILIGGDGNAVGVGISPAIGFEAGGIIYLSGCNLIGGTTESTRNAAVRYQATNNFNLTTNPQFTAINCTITGGSLSPGVYVGSTLPNTTMFLKNCRVTSGTGANGIFNESTTTRINLENSDIQANNAAAAIQHPSTSTVPISTSGNIINAPNGRQAIYAPRHQVFPSSSPTYTRHAVNGYDSFVDYWTSNTTFSYPLSTDVVLNTTYNNGALTGRMVLPSSSNVFYDVNIGPATLTSMDMVSGNRYRITNPGTSNFVTVGSPDNNRGTTFTATSSVSGTGLVSLVGNQIPLPSNIFNLPLSSIPNVPGTVGHKIRNILTYPTLSAFTNSMRVSTPKQLFLFGFASNWNDNLPWDDNVNIQE